MPNFDVDESGGSKDRRLLFQEAIAAQAAERARELQHLRGQVEQFSFFLLSIALEVRVRCLLFLSVGKGARVAYVCTGSQRNFSFARVMYFFKTFFITGQYSLNQVQVDGPPSESVAAR